MCHKLQEGRARKAAVVSAPKDDFLIIDAEIELCSKRAITRRTRLLLSRLMRIAAFRRSEALRLTVDDIPSMGALRMLRDRVAQGTAEPIIRFMIISSKNGGAREVSIPLSLALEIRDFIETERAALLDRKGIAAKSHRAVFLSQKTGKALTPQSITNYWKIAAHKAARRLRRPELAAHRPHFSRHRGITDHAREHLRAGRSPAETMYKVLEFARIARLSTAHIYVHLAQDELKPRILPAESTESDARIQEAEIQELRMMERQF
jgi:site-specific recombinase XerD